MIESESDNIENNEAKESIIEARLLNLHEAKEKEEKDGEQNFPRIIEQLPKDLRPDIQKKFERLKSYGLSDKQLAYELKLEVRDLKSAYEDKRFEIPNGSYLRYEISHLVDSLVNEKVNITKIRGLGILNFDVNGLKAVNDISGHEKGNEYLKRIVNTLKNGHTTKDLEENGIKVFVSSNGGDEFAIILSDDVNLTEIQDGQIFIDKILKYYQEEISSVDMSDIIDFSDPEVIKKFEGIEIPKDFKFTASISGGAALLEEILTDEEVFRSIEDELLEYTDKLNKIISHLFEISDKRNKEDKNSFKRDLDQNEDENKNFLSIVLKRNAEAASLEIENRRLKEIIAEFEKSK